MQRYGNRILWGIALSILALLALLWGLRPQPVYSGRVPYLRGSTQWPDSMGKALTPEQQIAQLILYAPERGGNSTVRRTRQLARTARLGGAGLTGLRVKQYLLFSDSVYQEAPVPLFFFSGQPILHHNLFSDTPHFPAQDVLSRVGLPHLPKGLSDAYAEQSHALGLNLTVPFSLDRNWRDTTAQIRLLKDLLKKRILCGAGGLPDYAPALADTSAALRAYMAPLQRLADQGLGLVLMDQPVHGSEDPQALEQDFYRDFLRRSTGYEGLIAGKISRETPLPYLLRAGVDLFITDQDPAILAKKLAQALDDRSWGRNALRNSLQKVLLAKQWMYGSHTAKNTAAQYQPLQNSPSAPQADQRNPRQIERYFKDRSWEYFAFSLREKSLTIPSNPKGLLPWKNMEAQSFYLWQASQDSFPDFVAMFEKYADAQPFHTFQAEIPGGQHTPPAFVVLMDASSPAYFSSPRLRARLDSLHARFPVVVVQFGSTILPLDSTFTILRTPERHPQMEALAAQLFFGGGSALEHSMGEDDTLYSSPKIRLRHTAYLYGPAAVTGQFDRLDALARLAVSKRYTPGCQILVAHHGDIVYHKSFGKHSTPESAEVGDEDLYDIASLTKAACTSLLTMQYRDEGRIQLNAPIDRYLPWLRRTRIGRVPVWQLLSHQSGLPAAIPTAKYIKFRKYSRRACDPYFCNRRRGAYTVPVTERLYFNRRYLEEIRRAVARIRPAGGQRYKYSDLNYWLLGQVIESVGQKSLDQLAQERLYAPLGLRYTTFKPRQRVSPNQLIPTEIDKTWRRQLLQGTVHDPSAAILGGVSGHAGLFSNTADLAPLLQTLLDRGAYGGKTYFSPAVVERFTQVRVGSRSLGFDRPSAENRFKRVRKASPRTFGHTGFTGGCAWVDPDHGLLFIFLSNRVFPNARENRGLLREHIRERLLEATYEALEKKPALELPAL
ncbi:MAG: serine hydrolase domain-containing protein [Saprospiraceae bacterium]